MQFYGYQLQRATGLRSGTMYAVLGRLADEGMVTTTAELGDPAALGRPLRTYYTLTDQGAQALGAMLTRSGDLVGWPLAAVAGACDQIASLVLGEGVPQPNPLEMGNTWWVRDRSASQQQFGTPEPTQWIVNAVATYLPEAAHGLRSISVLLRAAMVTGSLGPLVRAVIERASIAFWLLDIDGVDTVERCWRGCLNALVCMKEYRKTVEQLSADASQRREVQSTHLKLRAQVKKWFDPEVDQGEPKDASLWTLNGKGFPELTDLAADAMPSDLMLKVRKGMYGAQCGMTHPNVWVIGETIEPLGSGSFQFRHRPEDVDKEVRAAYVLFMRSTVAWARYFLIERDFNEFTQRVDTINEKFEQASAAYLDDRR